MPLVRILFAAFLSIALSSFYFNTASPEGDWQCMTKSGRQDEHTWYQVNCSGNITLKNNGTVKSSITEVFFPSGALWKTEGNQLTLFDSDDLPFVTYSWQMPDERTLILEKKGITYTFDRVFVPQVSAH